MRIKEHRERAGIRYLLRQCEALASEVDDAGADPDSSAQLLRDYWNMAEMLGRDLSDPSVKYPADLIAAHDRASELMKQKEANGMACVRAGAPRGQAGRPPLKQQTTRKTKRKKEAA